MQKRLEDVTTHLMMKYATHQEAQLRECLGRWVSELEPVMVFKGLRFCGLGIAVEPGQKCPVHVKVPKVSKKHAPGRFFDHDALHRASIDDDDA